jgi:ankyrin repeat protein
MEYLNRSSEHYHSRQCCPIGGRWCKKFGIGNESSLAYAIDTGVSEAKCMQALSKTRNIHVVHNNNETLLHRAMRQPYTQLAQLMINIGIDVHAITHNGDTPLFIAAIFQPTQVKLLINNGANVNVINYYGETPLHKASNCNRPDICTLLFEEGADVNLGIGIRHSGHFYDMHYVLVAWGLFFSKIEPCVLPQYLAASENVAFSRRKTAIRWWFWVQEQVHRN